MYVRTASAVLAVLLCSFGPGSGPWSLSRIVAIYRKANALYRLPSPSTAQNKVALAGFEQVIDEYKKLPGYDEKDTLLFQSYLKKGVLLEVQSDFSGARDAYMEALRIHPQQDSMGFVATVSAGANYYNLYNFDSASSLLLKAEMLAVRFKDDDDAIRLYNTLGALYLDNGNYQQGKNYFHKALDIDEQKAKPDIAFEVSIQTNIATACYHLGQFQQALDIYQKVLSYKMGTDAIYMNMGIAYSSLQRYGEALVHLKKVDEDKIPNVLNEMAFAELQLQHYDSAALFLDRLQTRFMQSSAGLNDLDLGISELYRSDLLAAKSQHRAALEQLQKAILLFTPSFVKTDIYSNPTDFTGAFVSFRLFDALSKKALLFHRLYEVEGKQQDLLASFEAYKAALNLLRYIEKTYDTDDAKVFLKENNPTIYPRAISVGIELYRLHPGADYLQQAFLINEQSRASIMAANLQENRLEHLSAQEAGLLKKERDLKHAIARLNVKTGETADRSERQQIAAERSSYEIALSRVQREMERNGRYYRLKYDDAVPGISSLQELLGNGQALISFSVGEEKVHVFVLTRHSFGYTSIDSLKSLEQNVTAWLDGLKSEGNGQRYRGEKISANLYRLLIKPLQSLAGDQEEWTIIPDGFLSFLPFESLPADDKEEGEYLLETTVIGYQLSARFMRADDTPSLSLSPQVLGFAPFYKAVDIGTRPGQANAFAPLPGSREEIFGLPGLQFYGPEATKQEFLDHLNQYPIIHFATHAVSSPDDAAASFIAFYPQTGSAIEDRLFLEELYGFDMDSTKLVIMSACETGQGQLVNNEGVISLARAFAYSGCASTISSLWKTDDRATSIILKQFYRYLKQGASKARALQQAKLDYLRSGTINKSPAYWAALVLTGSTEPLYHPAFPWKTGLIGLIGVLAIIFVLYTWRSRGRVKTAS